MRDPNDSGKRALDLIDRLCLQSFSDVGSRFGEFDRSWQRIGRPAAARLAAAICLVTAALFAQPFTGTALAAQEDRTFRPLRSLGSGSELSASISLGDVNGDGALDVVVANGRHWPGQNRIYLNDGRAAFTLARPLGQEQAGSYAVPLADLDGDGDLDIAVGNDRTRNLVFLNDGSGRFEPGATFGTPSPTRSLTLADLDGDGHTDILVVNRRRQNFIFFGDGSGAFGDGVPFGSGEDSTIDVAAADLDGDGDPDLVLAIRDGGANTIHWNEAGSFERVTVYGTGSDETRGVAVGDVDGDGRADIVTANIGEANAVYFGDGAGGFERSVTFGPGDDRSYAVRLADLDLDGDLDIVVANVGGRNAVYFNWRGWGGGGVAAAGFGDSEAFSELRFGCEDCATYGLAVGDLNGDGFPEIVTANSGAPNGLFGNVGVGR